MALEKLRQHPDFETWLEKGEVPKDTIETIYNSLKIQERFADQPGRFYASAVALVKEVYKSWFALQQRRQRQIKGKERWLNMLKSDIELQQESQCNLDVIRVKATEILDSFLTKFTQEKNKQSKTKKANKTKKNKKMSSKTTLFGGLFDTYDKTEDCLSKCALAYLLKNNCRVSKVDEDPEQYAKSKRKKEIEIERLRNQIKSQQQQRLSHERHKAQKQNALNSSGESELGQYVDRLLADAIVAIAKTYSAGSIVLPKLGDMREIIQSEVQAKAEKKFQVTRKVNKTMQKIIVSAFTVGAMVD